MTDSNSLPYGVNSSGGIDDSATPEVCNQNGNKALAAGNHTTAAQWYTAGLHRDAPIDLHHILLANRSSAYAHLCDFRRSLNDAETCVQLQPNWPRGHACRGAALEGLGRHAEALVAFEEAMRLDPTNTELAEIVTEVRQSLAQNQSQPTQYPPPSNVSLPSTVTSVPQNQASLPVQAQQFASTLAGRSPDPANNQIYSSSPTLTTSVQQEKQAGVGMHIVLDDSHPGAPRVVIMQLAPWSPLQGHVIPGDLLTAIDGRRLENVPFEQVSQMILGTPGSPVNLTFLRPTAYPVKEWDVGITRVSPQGGLYSSTNTPLSTRHVVAPSPQATQKEAPPSAQSAVSVARSPQQAAYRASVESVLTAIPVYMSLTFDEDYSRVASSEQTAQFFKNKLRIDLASSLQVAPARFAIGNLAPGSVVAGIQIQPSPSAGSGIPGVEPLTPAEIAADLKAQSVDAGSALRRTMPTLRHAQITDTPLQSGPQAPGSAQTTGGSVDSDIFRNFSEELQLLALFCKAPATESNLASFSKQGSKLKPKHVLRAYEAVHELKKDLGKSMEDVTRLQGELSSNSQSMAGTAEVQKMNEEATRLQKGLEIRDRAITTYKDELAALKQQIAITQREKEDMDAKVKEQRDMIVKQEDLISSLRMNMTHPAVKENVYANSLNDGQQAQLQAQLREKELEVEQLAGQLADARMKAEKAEKPLPCISLVNGNSYGKDELKTMVPNYEWDTFFSELLKIKPKTSASPPSQAQAVAQAAVAVAAPQQAARAMPPEAAAPVAAAAPPAAAPAPAPAPAPAAPSLEPPAPANNPSNGVDEPPLPEGWTKDMYQGKALYVNHATRSYSWIHPAEVKTAGTSQTASPEAGISAGQAGQALQDAKAQIKNAAGGRGEVPSSSLQR